MLLLLRTFDAAIVADTAEEEDDGFFDADNDNSDALDAGGSLREGPLSGVSVADDPPSCS